MSVRSMHELHLAQADRHIAATEGRILRQTEIVAKLAASENESHLDQTRTLLAGFQQSLKLMQEHRRAILEELGLSLEGD